MKKFLEKYAIWIIVGFFMVVYSALVLIRHERFESFGYDLGLYDQILWKYSQFKIPFSTIKIPNMILLGDHFHPVFTIFTPLYWLWSDVRALLLLQTGLICVSGYIIYTLAKNILKSTILSLVLAICYLSFYGIQNALAFDVHMITLASALLPFLFYFLHFKKFFFYWLFFFIILGLKEDTSIILFSLGIYAFLQYGYKKLALLTMVISLVWFFFVTKIGIPYFSGEFTHNVNFPNNWESLKAVFLPMEKWQTVFWSFLPFAFLPLFSKSIMPMVIIHFFVHWLDQKYNGRWGMALHYRVPIASILAIGSVWVIKKILDLKIPNPKSQIPNKSQIPISKYGGASSIITKNRVVMQIVALLLILILFSQYKLHLPLNNLLKLDFYRDEQWRKDTRELMDKIPKNASVITQNNFIPHLSHRDKIYLFSIVEYPYGTENMPCLSQKNCWWLRYDKADYILVNLAENQSANNFWGESVSKVRETMGNLERTGMYKLKERKGEIYLYKLKSQISNLKT